MPNELFVMSGYEETPFTPYKIQIISMLKGEVSIEVIEMYLLGGYDEDNVFHSNLNWSYNPKVGDTYLILSLIAISAFDESDFRVTEGEIYTIPSDYHMIPLDSYDEQSDINDQQNDIKELIREYEQAIDETEDLSFNDIKDK